MPGEGLFAGEPVLFVEDVCESGKIFE